jgi:hypothetical protein
MSGVVEATHPDWAIMQNQSKITDGARVSNIRARVLNACVIDYRVSISIGASNELQTQMEIKLLSIIFGLMNIRIYWR